MPPSPGRALPLSQHCSVCIPEAILYFLPIPGPGGVISVLSGASSCEPPHLQHEEPGAQGCPQEDTPTYPVSPPERCSSCSQDYKTFRKSLIDFMWCFCFFFMSVCHTYNKFNSNEIIFIIRLYVCLFLLLCDEPILLKELGYMKR